MEPNVSDDGSARQRQLGRRLGLGVYAFLVAGFTVICSVQICLQVWAPRTEPAPFDCSAGTVALVEAIDLARAAAENEPDEYAALDKFRGALAPTWKYRPALTRACSQSREALRHLQAVDHLRYAEEHAVRYAAVDLTQRRHEVKRLITSLRQSSQHSL
ncbi:MAG TPA: hypothetical protein VNN80_17580 [Polyangiaceae bacterium]|jgi:hypothetical protein|nr:hypothetical protein [Polyangiaceae bacterium]